MVDLMIGHTQSRQAGGYFCSRERENSGAIEVIFKVAPNNIANPKKSFLVLCDPVILLGV